MRAAQTLGKIGPGARAALGALTDALNDPLEDIREAAAVALRQVRGEQEERK